MHQAPPNAVELLQLIATCEEIAARLLSSPKDTRLGASYPFLTMLSVAICGWLMEISGEAAMNGGNDPAMQVKRTAAIFYLTQIFPEAMGRKAAAIASADILYQVEADMFAA